MPLPWKKDKDKHKPKNNINRSLSKFINEIRASKRGESLVVETGFPTSLIDLIVKNRNRFNNNTNSAKKHPDYIQSYANTPLLTNTHTPPLAPFILNSIDTMMSQPEPPESQAADNASSCSEVEICLAKSVRKGGVVVIVIKLFVVVFILAISTKKFTISITLSAFILLFLEILLKAFANEYRRLISFQNGERRLSLIGVDDDDDDFVVANFVDFKQEFEGLVRERKVTQIEFGASEVKNQVFGGDKETNGKPRRMVSDMSPVKDEMMPKPRRTVSDKLKSKFKKLGGEKKNRRNKKDCTAQSTDCVIEDAGEEEEENDDGDGAKGEVVDTNQENLGAAKMKDDEQTNVGVAFETPRRPVSTKVRATRFVKKIGDELKHRRNKKDRKLDKNTIQFTKDGAIQGGEEQEKDEEVTDHNDEDIEEEEADISDVISISETSSDLGFQKSMGRRRNWNWSTSILVLIVLAGLVGGRIMALVLSILCLLLHRLVGAASGKKCVM